MDVKLQSVTPNAEDNIVEIARVSSSRKDKKAKPEGLINYLINHKHFSPFEHSYLTLEINTSKAIGIQLIRHRSFTFQEFSQRYADPAEMGYPFEMRECRLQDTKNRQNSIDNIDPFIRQEFQIKMQRHFDEGMKLYKEMLDASIAKECARFVLPLACPTKIYMTGSVRSWIHYIDLRSANGTQKEHIDLALGAKEIFCEQFPAVAEAMEWNS